MEVYNRALDSAYLAGPSGRRLVVPTTDTTQVRTSTEVEHMSHDRAGRGAPRKRGEGAVEPRQPFDIAARD